MLSTNNAFKCVVIKNDKMFIFFYFSQNMPSAITTVAFRPAAIVKGTILKIPGMIMVMMMIMMMIMMMMRKVSKWKTKQTFFLSKPEDVLWHYQCRTGTNQRDSRTPICCPEKSAQRWSSWKSCSQKAVTPTRNRSQETQLCGKHGKWDAAKWQQVLWSDESKCEIYGWSRRQFVHWRAGEWYMNECLQQWSAVPCKSGAAFL